VPFLGKRGCTDLIGLIAFIVLTASASSAQQAPPAQTRSADARFVRIEHSTHPLASKSSAAEVSDAGPVEDGRVIERMLLTLPSSMGKQQDLRQFLDQQQNPTSEDYHRWLTPAAYGAMFGADPTNVQRAGAWLEQSGFTVTAISKGGNWIEFAGTSRQVNQAFRTELHYFQLYGKRYVANTRDISLPESIAQISGGPLSLNNFPKHPPANLESAAASRTELQQKVTLKPNLTAVGSTDIYYLAPGDFATIYNTKPLLTSGNDGSGIAIAVTAQSQIELTDVQAFRNIFQLKPKDPSVLLSGPDPGITDPIDQEEATLDVEWAGAVAPGATISLVIAGTTDSTNGVDLAAAYAVDNQVAPILTYTYGTCEQSLGPSGNAFYNALWQQAAAEGITVLVATGDNGSAACDSEDSGMPASLGMTVNGAAATPFNVAVGGTEFAENGSFAAYWNPSNAADYSSALGYIPEQAWNESCDLSQVPGATNCILANGNFSMLAGGGGASSLYPKPSWQTGPGVPADGWRDIPDVSLAAASNHDEIVYCNSIGGIPCEVNSQNQVVGLTLAGGTSASTPEMAGILALVEQKNGAYQGQINYVLYKLAQNAGASCNSAAQTNPVAQNSCIFYDITVGDNAVPCAGGTPQCTSTQAGIDGVMQGQTTSAGYDMATGLGSVNATNLANSWNNIVFVGSQTKLQLPTTSFPHGTAATVTGTVVAAKGAGTPTGTISLKTGLFGNADVLPLASGSFSATVTDLPGGQYPLTAYYGGDGSFATSSSNIVTVNVAPESSTTTLNADGLQPSSTPYGSPVQLQVKVQGLSGAGVATGNVTLQDGATAIGTYSLTADSGAYIATGSGSPFSFAVGPHSVTAIYAGDNSFNSSTSAPVTFTIGKTSPLVIVGLNESTVDSTQPVGAHVIVTGFGTALASGTVQFTVDGLPYGSLLPLQSSGFFGTQAQVSTLITGLSAGSHVIGVNYDGSNDPNYLSVLNSDGNHEPNDPSLVVTTGAGAATTTTLSAVSLPVNIGDTGKFIITVSPSTATGTVALWDAVGGRTSPTAIAGGSATIQFPWTQGGTTALYALYSGDATDAPSSSMSVTFTVNPGIPLVVLAAPAKSTSTQQISLDATVTGINSGGQPAGSALPYPTGVIEFWDSVNGAAAQLLAQQNLTVGGARTALFALRTTLAAGTHTLHSHYRGDINWQPEDSASVTVATASSADFTLSISPNTVAFNAGSPGSASVLVTPSGGFTGSVALGCPTGSGFPITGYSCAIAPSSVAINSTSAGTATLSLTPTAAAGATIFPTATFRTGPGFTSLKLAGVTAFGSLFVLCGWFFYRSWDDSKPRLRYVTASGWILCATSLVLGCGGGGGGGSGGGGKVSSTATLNSTNLHANYQTPVTFNVAINASSTPTGTVQLLDNGQIYTSGTVSAGIATFTTTTLPIGMHVITAQYSGDANTFPSNSASITQIVAGSVQLQISAVSGASTHTANVTVAVN